MSENDYISNLIKQIDNAPFDVRLSVGLQDALRIASAVAYKQTRDNNNIADYQDLFQELYLSLTTKPIDDDRLFKLRERANDDFGVVALEIARRATCILRTIAFAEKNHKQQNRLVCLCNIDDEPDGAFDVGTYYDENQKEFFPDVLTIARWIVNRKPAPFNERTVKALNILIETGALSWSFPAVDYNGFYFVDCNGKLVKDDNFIKLNRAENNVLDGVLKTVNATGFLFDTGKTGLSKKTLRARSRLVWRQSLVVYYWIKRLARPGDFSDGWRCLFDNNKRLTPGAIQTLRKAFDKALQLTA